MLITCVVVDDHTLFREGLRHLLLREADLDVVGEAADAGAAVEVVREQQPDVVLMDIGMPGVSSYDAARTIRKNWPATRLVFLTMFEDEAYLLRAVDAGASGYLLKDMPGPDLVFAVREVYAGRKYFAPRVLGGMGEPPLGRRSRRFAALTPRECEIVKMIAEGNSVRKIAGILGLSAKTVEAHKFNLMRKLKIHNVAQLVTYAIQKKIVPVPSEA
ncbi:MAG TPA: response regulator transcription factor [Terriglobales bacterium]|nr:response regulator transcription factor [Terriglobales bacterium]